MTPHPLAEMLPTLPETALAALTEDIRAQGLLESIVTLDGQVLDGRHRLAACEAAGVAPRFVEFDGEDPLAFVLSKNLHRRHLNESQRSMVAARLATLKRGGDRRSADFKVQICTLNQEQAAESLNVSERSVKSARKVLDLGLPALTQIVEQGQMPVSTAAAVAELPPAEQEKIVSMADAKARRTAARAVLLKDRLARPAKPRKININTGHTPPSDEDLAIYGRLLGILGDINHHLAGRHPEWLAREFVRRFPWGLSSCVAELEDHFQPAYDLMAALHTELQKQKKTRR